MNRIDRDMPFAYATTFEGRRVTVDNPDYNPSGPNAFFPTSLPPDYVGQRFRCGIPVGLGCLRYNRP